MLAIQGLFVYDKHSIQNINMTYRNGKMPLVYPIIWIGLIALDLLVVLNFFVLQERLHTAANISKVTLTTATWKPIES